MGREKQGSSAVSTPAWKLRRRRGRNTTTAVQAGACRGAVARGRKAAAVSSRAASAEASTAVLGLERSLPGNVLDDLFLAFVPGFFDDLAGSSPVFIAVGKAVRPPIFSGSYGDEA
jgi:hypothetical protein